MSPAQVAGAVAALVIAVGVTLTVLGVQPIDQPAARGGSRRLGRRGGRVALVVAAGLLAWGATGWPALGLAASAAAVGLPAMLGADRRAKEAIDRVEAVQEWARRVADILAIGVGLEQALAGAARSAPAAIRAQTATLAARIAAGSGTEGALRQFADELADPTADLVVAALILASRRRGPGVAAALTAIADSAAEEVAARRRIEADRAKPRATARAVTLITVGIITLGLLNADYTAPYGGPVGQVVLAGTLGFFAAALWWMHRMTAGVALPRILDRQPRQVRQARP